MGDDQSYIVQEILRRHEQARAERQQRLAREELDQVLDRVQKICNDYDKLSTRSKASLLVTEDLDELEAIMMDPSRRNKHQQEMMVLIVGYQNASKERLNLMGHVGDFLGTNARYFLDDETVSKDGSPTFDYEHGFQEFDRAMSYASTMAEKLKNLEEQIVECLINYANNKGGKLRKKLEMALNQAKNDIRNLSEKLLAAQQELDDRKETLIANVRELESRRAEAAKFRKELEEAQRNQSRLAHSVEALHDRDQKIEAQERMIMNLQIDLEDARRQKDVLRMQNDNMTGKLENKLAELESQLLKKTSTLNKTKMDLGDLLDRVVKELTDKHAEAIETTIAEYEDRINAINEAHKLEVQEKINRIYQLDERNEQLQSNDAIVEEDESVIEGPIDVNQPPPSGKEPEKPPTATTTATTTATNKYKFRVEQMRAAVRRLELQAAAYSDQEVALPRPEAVSKYVQVSVLTEEASVQVKTISERPPTVPKSVGKKKSVTEIVRPLSISPTGPPFDIFDEESWSSVPDPELRGRFAQFRDIARARIQELEMEFGSADATGKQSADLMRADFDMASKEAVNSKSLITQMARTFVQQGEDLLQMQAATEQEANAVMRDLKEAVESITPTPPAPVPLYPPIPLSRTVSRTISNKPPLRLERSIRIVTTVRNDHLGRSILSSVSTSSQPPSSSSTTNHEYAAQNAAYFLPTIVRFCFITIHIHWVAPTSTILGTILVASILYSLHVVEERNSTELAHLLLLVVIILLLQNVSLTCRSGVPSNLWLWPMLNGNLLPPKAVLFGKGDSENDEISGNSETGSSSGTGSGDSQDKSKSEESGLPSANSSGGSETNGSSSGSGDGSGDDDDDDDDDNGDTQSDDDNEEEEETSEETETEESEESEESVEESGNSEEDDSDDTSETTDDDETSEETESESSEEEDVFEKESTSKDEKARIKQGRRKGSKSEQPTKSRKTEKPVDDFDDDIRIEAVSPNSGSPIFKNRKPVVPSTGKTTKETTKEKRKGGKKKKKKKLSESSESSESETSSTSESSSDTASTASSESSAATLKRSESPATLTGRSRDSPIKGNITHRSATSGTSETSSSKNGQTGSSGSSDSKGVTETTMDEKFSEFDEMTPSGKNRFRDFIAPFSKSPPVRLIDQTRPQSANNSRRTYTPESDGGAVIISRTKMRPFSAFARSSDEAMCHPRQLKTGKGTQQNHQNDAEFDASGAASSPSVSLKAFNETGSRRGNSQSLSSSTQQKAVESLHHDSLLKTILSAKGNASAKNEMASPTESEKFAQKFTYYVLQLATNSFMGTSSGLEEENNRANADQSKSQCNMTENEFNEEVSSYVAAVISLALCSFQPKISGNETKRSMPEVAIAKEPRAVKRRTKEQLPSNEQHQVVSPKEKIVSGVVKNDDNHSHAKSRKIRVRSQDVESKELLNVKQKKRRHTVHLNRLPDRSEMLEQGPPAVKEGSPTSSTKNSAVSEKNSKRKSNSASSKRKRHRKGRKHGKRTATGDTEQNAERRSHTSSSAKSKKSRHRSASSRSHSARKRAEKPTENMQDFGQPHDARDMNNEIIEEPVKQEPTEPSREILKRRQSSKFLQKDQESVLITELAEQDSTKIEHAHVRRHLSSHHAEKIEDTTGHTDLYTTDSKDYDKHDNAMATNEAISDTSSDKKERLQLSKRLSSASNDYYENEVNVEISEGNVMQSEDNEAPSSVSSEQHDVRHSSDEQAAETVIFEPYQDDMYVSVERGTHVNIQEPEEFEEIQTVRRETAATDLHVTPPKRPATAKPATSGKPILSKTLKPRPASSGKAVSFSTEEPVEHVAQAWENRLEILAQPRRKYVRTEMQLLEDARKYHLSPTGPYVILANNNEGLLTSNQNDVTEGALSATKVNLAERASVAKSATKLSTLDTIAIDPRFSTSKPLMAPNNQPDLFIQPLQPALRDPANRIVISPTNIHLDQSAACEVRVGPSTPVNIYSRPGSSPLIREASSAHPAVVVSSRGNASNRKAHSAKPNVRVTSSVITNLTRGTAYRIYGNLANQQQSRVKSAMLTTRYSNPEQEENQDSMPGFRRELRRPVTATARLSSLLGHSPVNVEQVAIPVRVSPWMRPRLLSARQRPVSSENAETGFSEPMRTAEPGDGSDNNNELSADEGCPPPTETSSVMTKPAKQHKHHRQISRQGLGAKQPSQDVVEEYKKSYSTVLQLGSDIFESVRSKAPEALKDLDFQTAISSVIVQTRPPPAEGATRQEDTAGSTVTSTGDTGIGAGLSTVIADLESAADDSELAQRMTTHVNAVVNQIHDAFDRLMSLPLGGQGVSRTELDRLRVIQEELMDKLEKQQSTYEQKLNDQNTIVSELRETIEDLKKQLERLASSQKVPPEYAVMFTRLDVERNSRALNRAASNRRVSTQQIEDAIRAMEEYVDMPVQRLMHLIAQRRGEQLVDQPIPPKAVVHKFTVQTASALAEAAADVGPLLSADIEELAEERVRLAEDIMLKLQAIEREAGIFLIKPYFSYPGRQIHDRERFKFKTNRPLQDYEPMMTTGQIIHAGRIVQAGSTIAEEVVNCELSTGRQPVEKSPLPAVPQGHHQLAPIQRRSKQHGAPSGIDGARAPSLVSPPPPGQWKPEDSRAMNETTANIAPYTSRLEEMDLKRYVVAQNIVSSAYPPDLRDAVPPGTRTARAYFGLTRDAPVIRLTENPISFFPMSSTTTGTATPATQVPVPVSNLPPLTPRGSRNASASVV